MENGSSAGQIICGGSLESRFASPAAAATHPVLRPITSMIFA